MDRRRPRRQALVFAGWKPAVHDARVSRFVFAAALVCAAPAFAETAYFAAIPDLPVAPGLSETASPFPAAIEGPNQQLILAAAHGSASPESVERFYGESLSALGWSYLPAPRPEGMTFVRGRERVTLHITPQGQGTQLNVRLLVRSVAINAD